MNGRGVSTWYTANENLIEITALTNIWETYCWNSFWQIKEKYNDYTYIDSYNEVKRTKKIRN